VNYYLAKSSEHRAFCAVGHGVVIIA